MPPSSRSIFLPTSGQVSEKRSPPLSLVKTTMVFFSSFDRFQGRQNPADALVHLADHGEVGRDRAAVEVVDLARCASTRPRRRASPRASAARCSAPTGGKALFLLSLDECNGRSVMQVGEVALAVHFLLALEQVVNAARVAVREVVHARRRASRRTPGSRSSAARNAAGSRGATCRPARWRSPRRAAARAASGARAAGPRRGSPRAAPLRIGSSAPPRSRCCQRPVISAKRVGEQTEELA